MSYPLAAVAVQPDHTKAIGLLNGLLTGELSAVETYERLIAEFGSESPIELDECLRSHQLRVQALKVRILDLRGTPGTGGGIWSTFVALFEGGAALFGRKTAFCALAEGEHLGVDEYRDCLEDLDSESRHLLTTRLIPEQLKTRHIVHNLYANQPTSV